MADSLETVGGQPGGQAVRNVLAVAHNDDGTLKTSAVTGADFSGLPAADPHVIGALYTASGAVKVSAG